MYDNYFIDKKESQDTYKSNKILCILEGKDELNLIKKIYEILEDIKLSCQDLIQNKIELSWGKNPTNWINKDKCNFQGGHIDGCFSPYPVLESLKNKNIDIYKAVLVMFDSDCDDNKIVYTKVENHLINYESFILYSNPCFEKEMVCFVCDEKTKEFIDHNYEIVNNSKCKWYKDNLSNIPKKYKFRKVQSLENTIKLLEDNDFDNCSTAFKPLKEFLNKLNN